MTYFHRANAERGHDPKHNLLFVEGSSSAEFKPVMEIQQQTFNFIKSPLEENVLLGLNRGRSCCKDINTDKCENILRLNESAHASL